MSRSVARRARRRRRARAVAASRSRGRFETLAGRSPGRTPRPIDRDTRAGGPNAGAREPQNIRGNRPSVVRRVLYREVFERIGNPSRGRVAGTRVARSIRARNETRDRATGSSRVFSKRRARNRARGEDASAPERRLFPPRTTRSRSCWCTRKTDSRARPSPRSRDGLRTARRTRSRRGPGPTRGTRATRPAGSIEERRVA